MDRFRAALDEANRTISMELKDQSFGLTATQQLQQIVGTHKAPKDFTIPSALANKLKPLIKKYFNAWDKMGTDGLKGMKIEDVRAIESWRQEIAKLVAESTASLDVKAAFLQQLNALASQTCSSRDVQNFNGWFKSHNPD